MPRKFVIGDIHGAFKALKQCLQRSGFVYEEDLLICIGDACDRWPDTYSVINELLKIRHCIFIMGNHDQWTMEWFRTGNIPYGWHVQGGRETIESYSGGVPAGHLEFYQRAVYYYKDANRLFVHGGFNLNCPIEEQDNETLIWDRDLILMAMERGESGPEQKLTSYDDIYVGHTPTIRFGSTRPIKACEVWMMDTGAGWGGGYLTIMNIDTKEYFQSDEVSILYKDYFTRI